MTPAGLYDSGSDVLRYETEKILGLRKSFAILWIEMGHLQSSSRPQEELEEGVARDADIAKDVVKAN